MAAPNGRPIKYTQEFIETEADALLKWIKDDEHIYLKRFSFERGYSSSRLTEFAKANEKFSLALEKAHDWQEMKLAEGGLKKTFDSGFTKFVLARTHGWTDKKEISHTADENAPQWLKDSINNSKDLVSNEKPAK